MKVLRLVCGAGIAGCFVAATPAQSLNIDLDVGFGDQGVGNGAPSSAFGGGAGQSGFWNAVYAGGPTVPVQLRQLDGSLSSVQMIATGGTGSYGGFNNTANTGGVALLMNDFADLGGADLEIDYHFSGLVAGRYLIYTYAVHPAGNTVGVTVTVPGSVVAAQVVTGPMPGNTFLQGVTHSVHDLTIAGNSFEIDVKSSQWPLGKCNGFQIVAVPEPSSLFACALGIGIVAIKRRKRM
jgi:hypothetical protein